MPVSMPYRFHASVRCLVMRCRPRCCGCIYMRGLLRCRPTIDGQCEKPRFVGRQQIQTLTLFPFFHNSPMPTRRRPRLTNRFQSMKHRKHFHAGYSLAVWATFVGLSVALPAIADTEVPCLVLSGHAQSEHSIDLSKLNRITFGSESMTISRAGGDAKETQELLYSLYHHIEIKNAMPDIETGAEATSAFSSSLLLPLRKSGQLWS